MSGYSYDVFRAGRWGGTNMEIPSGNDGLGILDNYEAIIWYSGWNTNIMQSETWSPFRLFRYRWKWHY